MKLRDWTEHAGDSDHGGNYEDLLEILAESEAETVIATLIQTFDAFVVVEV